MRASTQLHAAARNGNNRTVATLLAFGADKDELDAEGNSSLFLAARHDHAVQAHEAGVP